MTCLHGWKRVLCWLDTVGHAVMPDSVSALMRDPLCVLHDHYLIKQMEQS